MDNSLAPTYKILFGDYWILWFAKSNSYSIIDSLFKNLLDNYLQSNSKEEFITKFTTDNKVSNTETTIKTIQNYLKDSNRHDSVTKEPLIVTETTNRNILKQYLINGKAIQIYFDSELVLKTVHPALAHLAKDLIDDVDTVFDAYLKNEYLHLFQDNQLIIRVPKRDYHLMQGKFIMQLLCTIHNKEENDWIGTFHGSTLTDGDSSILFVGESGKGKSTLCALLATNGFDLLADDVSPMLSENKSIYHNPSAISIKEGAFNVLKSVVTNFNNLPIVQFNKTKGAIKYIPCDTPKKSQYPCKAIVMVNYVNKAETKLENVSVKTLLETLIPDSWISPNPFHAKQFLDWLKTLNIYKLTYSDTKSVTLEISELFKRLNKN